MLKDKIQADSKEALKNGDGLVLGTLRMTLSAILLKEKDKRYKLSKQDAELSDEEITDVIVSEVKKRRDAILLYEKGGRQELADKEKKEIDVLQKYLPKQMSEDDLKKLIQESILATGAKEIKDMGKVMSDITPKIKGKADAGQASKIVKELLSK